MSRTKFLIQSFVHQSVEPSELKAILSKKNKQPSGLWLVGTNGERHFVSDPTVHPLAKWKKAAKEGRVFILAGVRWHSKIDEL